MADQRGVFGISVVADLVGTGVQNLRAYERRGLVEPSRTAGGTRLYSEADVSRLHRIAELLGRGLNLAGIAMVLDLEADNARLQAELDEAAAPRGPAPPTSARRGSARREPRDPPRD